jgi:hypothetical protein
MAVCSRNPQPFCHPIRGIAFADKAIGSGRKRCLVAGIQMADENYYDCCWASRAQFKQGGIWGD